MTVYHIDRNRPRRPRTPDGDEARELLADLLALSYADDMICEDREEKWGITVQRINALLTTAERSAGHDRIYGPGTSE